MSHLDDPRVFFAAERTMLAWQRTAVVSIGLGFLVDGPDAELRSVSGRYGNGCLVYLESHTEPHHLTRCFLT
jgi:uncharacterized membrane protein YidH (DUF202 family)